MSEFTIIGDPHITHKSLDKAEILFQIAEDLNNSVIWLGDLMDTKEVIRGKCLNLLYEKLKQSSLHHFILIGNHDWFNLDCQDHSLQVLKGLKNVTIIDEPYYICREDTPILAIPYIHDLEKLRETLRQAPSNIIIIGHFDVTGLDYGNGYICEHGISVEEFSKFKYVISGHFHKYQHSGNFVYLGTPFSHSFGESNQDKYIGLLDRKEDNLLSLLETPFPKHRTHEINCDSPNPSSIIEPPKGDILRVILSGNKENISKFKTSQSFPEGTKIIEKPIEEFNTQIFIEETSDNASKFKTWAQNIRQLDEGTVNLGLAILESVK